MNDSITTSLRALANGTERMLADRIRHLDLTVPQLEYLAILAANPDYSGADTAEEAHVSPQTGTTILRNLIIKRLITVRHVPGMGRRNEITVTAHGKNTLGQAQEAVADVEKRLRALLGPEAASMLNGAVTSLQKHLPKRR